MPHDMFDYELHEGDYVNLPLRIIKVIPGADACNVVAVPLHGSVKYEMTLTADGLQKVVPAPPAAEPA